MSGLLTTGQMLGLIAAALIGFWIVGAYNRLVRLRTSIHEAYAAMEAQIRQRDELLAAWTSELRQVFDDSAQVDGVEAAAARFLQTAELARQRPSAAPAVANLALAEAALVTARGQLAAALPSHVNRPTLSQRAGDLSGLGDRILAVDSTLAFARQQFNAAAEVYNAALAQFPTTLIAALFGFQAAGTF
ncbi:MAG: LemA family protein [Ideonella sp.]